MTLITLTCVLLLHFSDTLSRKACSLSWKPSFGLHRRFPSMFQTNFYGHIPLDVSQVAHRLHLRIWFSSRLLYYSEQATTTCHLRNMVEISESFWTLPTCHHPPLPSYIQHLMHYQSLQFYLLDISQIQFLLFFHPHYHCLGSGAPPLPCLNF